MKIKAYLLEMAASEILRIIPTSEYLKIKAQDEHPQFRAYIIGHEGDSSGNVIVDGKNIGKVVKTWYKSAIQNLYRKLKFGLQLFHGHSYDNSQEGRMPIGQVVGKAIQTIKDKLSVIAVTYIKPEFRQLPLDVASIEADIRLRDDNGTYAAEVDEIQGIALGYHKTEVPGFAQATLLSQVQEFAESTFKGKGEEMEITIDGIKDFIKAEKILPTDLFSLGELTETQDIKDLIAASERQARQGEYQHRKRTDDKFDTERQKWDDEKKGLEGIIAKLKPIAVKNTRDELFKGIAEERKLDEKEIAFISRSIGGFNPENIDSMKGELNKFVDTQLDEYKSVAEDVFGIKPDAEPSRKGGAEPGAEDGEKTHSVDENPMIP